MSDRNKFYPPGERRGKQGKSDEYPDVVGAGARAERGLAAPTRRPLGGDYPMIVGAVDAQRRAGDRALAKLNWKPPVDRKPGVPLTEYPRIVIEGRYDDPKPKLKIPPVLNEDGSVWRPPVDRDKPGSPRSVYPQIRVGSRIGRPVRYVPADPRSDPAYYPERVPRMSESSRLYFKNCLGITGEGARSLLNYDELGGTLTWREGSGPRSGHDVPKNRNMLMRMGGFGRNVYGVIFLIMLDRLPTGWVNPLDHDMFNWSWSNIRPSESNVC